MGEAIRVWYDKEGDYLAIPKNFSPYGIFRFQSWPPDRNSCQFTFPACIFVGNEALVRMTANTAPRWRRRQIGSVRVFALLGPLVGVLGCSAPQLGQLGPEQLRANAQRLSPEQLTKQRSVSARELFRDPSFEREDMQNEGVTCLAARLSFGNETYGRPLVQGLVDAINVHLDGRGVIHPNLVASEINTAGLAHDYANMLTAYDKTNILDQKTLDKIATVSQVRYFAVPILVNFKEGGSNRISVFGMRLVKTAWTT